MARCPFGIGCGGSRCRNCLRDVDLNTTVVLYSERPSAFRVMYDKVVVASCSGGA